MRQSAPIVCPQNPQHTTDTRLRPLFKANMSPNGASALLHRVVKTTYSTTTARAAEDDSKNAFATSPSWRNARPVGEHERLSRRLDSKLPFVGGDGRILAEDSEGATIFACSPLRARSLLGKRVLLSDRKKPFEHLRPRALFFSSIRTGVLQCGQVFTTYLTDQIEYETANEELIVQGEITVQEAEERNRRWEENEWEIRTKKLPSKALTAFLKLQSATLIMRMYEYLASRFVSVKTLDKLTKDPFQSAKRKYAKYGDQGDMVVGKRMFHTCMWSNALSFLSDYTVQQCIVITAHILYYRNKRQRSRSRKDADGNGNSNGKGSDIETGGIGLSLALMSSKLATSRASSWVISSATGAVGSVIYPGWGTLFGTQLGDGLVGALLDN